MHTTEKIIPVNTLLSPVQADETWQHLMDAKRIAIVSHRHPDPDTIGSNLCLRRVLEKFGKQVQSVAVDPLPQTCSFLSGFETFKNTLEFDHDLVVTVDCGSKTQTGIASIIDNTLALPVLNIDHHASNEGWGSFNLVYPDLSSTCEIIYHLLDSHGIAIDSVMATDLLIGIYYDTGSFMHSNVTADLLKAASSLLEQGADLPNIKRHLFQNFTEEKYHLWGNTLENMKLSEKGTAIAVITNETLNAPGVNQESLSGLIDYVSMIKDSQFALLVNQEDEGHIRGSLRTRNDKINLSEMAARLGGGGHRKASGFAFPAKLEKQTIWTITK